MELPDYYGDLGIKLDGHPPASVPDDEIKKAFRKLAGKYHPDRNNDPSAEERMKKINAAHDVLGNKEAREIYDGMREFLNSSQNDIEDEEALRREALIQKIMEARENLKKFREKFDRERFAEKPTEPNQRGTQESYGNFTLNFENRETILTHEKLYGSSDQMIYLSDNRFRAYHEADFLKDIKKYLIEEFPKKNDLSNSEIRGFMDYLCGNIEDNNPFFRSFSDSHSKIRLEASIENGKPSFSDENKLELEEKLKKSLEDYREHKKIQIMKILIPFAMAVVTFGLPALMLTSGSPHSSDALPSDLMDKTHISQAAHQLNDINIELLKKINFYDRQNPNKIRKTLGDDKIKKDTNGKEYFTIYDKKIYLHDTKKLEEIASLVESKIANSTLQK